MNLKGSIVRLTLMIISFVTILSQGCSTSMPIAHEGGKGDVAYIVIASANSNVGKTVTVNVNDLRPFDANVVKLKDAKFNGTSYQIKPGRKSVKITRNGVVLYDSQVFISPQETKIITIQ